MSKAAKIWLIIAASLVLLGIIIFGGIMAVLSWDFMKLATSKNYETNTYEIDDDFNCISINTSTADVAFLLSDDEKCKIVCYEDEKMKHSVELSNGTLSVNEVDSRKWYEHISIFSNNNPMISIYLPKASEVSLVLKNSTGDVGLPKDITFESIDISGSTGDVNCYSSATGAIKIKRSTGNICLDNISADAIDLSVSTGEVTVSDIICKSDFSLTVSTGKAKLSDVSCKSFISDGDTGDLSLCNVVAKERFSIERSTGDVKLEDSDAAEIVIETDTGDVEGSLLSEKVFITETDTGDVEVPHSTTGGKCEITTDTGDINISIKQ